MTRQKYYTCLITCVFALLPAVQVDAMNTYKMYLMCGQEISLDMETVYTGILRFRFSTYLGSSKNCSIIVSSELSAHHISFYFDSLKIGPSCEYGYLVAQDGRFQASANIRGFPVRLCGDDVSLIAGNRYFSWGSNVRFQFTGTDQTPLGAGFDIVFTSFDDRPCRDDYYQCDNGHCIMSDLRCSGYDPCGDGSDCKPESLSGQIPGIAFGCIIGLLMIIFVVIRFCCCRKKSGCREVSASNTRSRIAASISRDGNQTARPDPAEFTYSLCLSDLPPPYEQVVNKGGLAYPSEPDLPTYEEATTGQIGIGLNK